MKLTKSKLSRKKTEQIDIKEQDVRSRVGSMRDAGLAELRA